MAVFWILAALMILAALAFALVPLARTRPAVGLDAHAANLAVLRAQRRELEADIASGSLSAEARAEALADLVKRAKQDLAPSPDPHEPASRPWPAIAMVAVAVPAIALGVYLATGNPAASDPRLAAGEKTKLEDAQVVSLVEALAQKVRERPDDVRGWSLLARSMAAIGRFRESSEAYEHLVKIAPPDAQLLADYADALGMAQGRSLAGRPAELARQALAIDAKNRKALALAGTAALDAGDAKEALRFFERLADEIEPGSDDAKQIQSVLAEVREKAVAKGGALVPTSKPASGGGPEASAASVSGAITVSPSLAAKVSASDTVFIFARAEGGPRAPLAVRRANGRELPLAFALDDSMSMSPQHKLSSTAALRVEARVSRSGNAMPQAGDLVGKSAVVKPGARDVVVVIDKELP